MADQPNQPLDEDKDVRVVVEIDPNKDHAEILAELAEDGWNLDFLWANQDTSRRTWNPKTWIQKESEVIFSSEIPRSRIPELRDKSWIVRMDESPRRRGGGSAMDGHEVAWDNDEVAEEFFGVQLGVPAEYLPMRPEQYTHLRGEKATIVIIDSGIDIFHRAFLNEDGSTRLYAIYDQRGNRLKNTKATNLGIEGLYLAKNINKLLKAGAAKNRDLPFRQRPGHGTMVASIAAGSKYEVEGKTFQGVAPDAQLIFICCHQGEYEDEQVHSLGYSMSHVMVLRALAKLAPQEKVKGMVMNMSFGEHLGAHDGSTLLEAQIGEFTGDGRKAGYCVVKSAGNCGGQAGYAQLQVQKNQLGELQLQLEPATMATERSVSVELWYESCFQMRVTAVDPQGRDVLSLDVAGCSGKSVSGFSVEKSKVAINTHRYHSDNGDTRVTLRIHRRLNNFENGLWTIRLERIDAHENMPTKVDAWIDLLDSKALTIPTAQDERTLTIPGTAEQVITVGAITTPGDPNSVAPFSSRGPSRNGANKPELTAPGCHVLGASAGGTTAIRKGFGTSYAAPQVAGAIALLYGKKLDNSEPLPNATQIKKALIHSCHGFEVGEHDPGAGYGTLNIDRFLEQL